MSNIFYMISLARKQRPSILYFCFLLGTLAVLLSVTQLLMVPVILNTIEDGAAISKLAGIVLLFTAALMALNAGSEYLISCSQFGRIELRLKLAGMIQNKVLTMPYPDIKNQDIPKKKDKAVMLVNSNRCATEVIWTTLSNLLKSIAEFVICISLLSVLHPAIIFTVLTATIISFSVSNYLNSWGYLHRDEESEYSRRMNYLSEKSRDYTLAKDVCIFGLGSWIEEVFDKTLRLYRRFMARGERVYIWGNIVDVIMTFLRNGIVYIFLIGAVLRGEMPVAEFILYFNAVNVFTCGIGNIMSGFADLRRQSLDISAVREFLEYPETFQMEGGTHLTPDPDIPYKIQFQKVSFRYPGAKKDTLSNIDLRSCIHKGKKSGKIEVWKKKNESRIPAT